MASAKFGLKTSLNNPSRNLRKAAARRSSIPVLEADFEDKFDVLEFSEVSDPNPESSAENSSASVDPVAAVSDPTSMLSPSSVTAAASEYDPTPMPSPSSVPAAASEYEYVEMEAMIKTITETRRTKGLNSGSSKKLMQALITVIIEENGGLFAENEWVDKLLARQSTKLFATAIMVMCPLLMVWFVKWGSEESFTGLVPT